MVLIYGSVLMVEMMVNRWYSQHSCLVKKVSFFSGSDSLPERILCPVRRHLSSDQRPKPAHRLLLRLFGIRSRCQVPDVFDLVCDEIVAQTTVIQSDRLWPMRVVGETEATAELCDKLKECPIISSLQPPSPTSHSLATPLPLDKPPAIPF